MVLPLTSAELKSFIPGYFVFNLLISVVVFVLLMVVPVKLAK